MKKVKSRRLSKQSESSSSPEPLTDLTSFSVANTISEASATITTPRKIFNVITSPLKKEKSNPSQVSLATNTSFATANDQHNDIITPASYFVDSVSDDEQSATYNDLLSVLAQPKSTDAKPTEISFSSNPEETTTMPSKKTTSKKILPMVEATAVPPTTKAMTKPAPNSDEAHFDVAQNTYGCVKDIWAWGTTVPVVSNLLGITEAVAAKILDTTIHMDLPTIDQDFVVPNMKKLDDEIVTPAITAVWKTIAPAIGKADDMIVKPVLTEVVPRVLAPLSMFSSEENKKAEERKAMIDTSATPEVVPALN